MTVDLSQKIRTWKVIAAELEVSIRKAQKLARRHFDPLQVFHDHAGIYTTRGVLDQWVKRYTVTLEEHDKARQDRKAS